MTGLRIEAPTDAQLAFIAKPVREQGWPAPECVASKAEAAEIIDLAHALYVDLDGGR